MFSWFVGWFSARRWVVRSRFVADDSRREFALQTRVQSIDNIDKPVAKFI
jgi:hypothetical protein